MTIESFPSVKLADKYGLLAIGGDLEVDSLLLAYRSGIFPWPIFEEQELTWFAPPKRALLFFKDFHPSSSLTKLWKQQRYQFAIDKNFELVISNCQTSKRDTRTKKTLENKTQENKTWITDEMKTAYIELHRAGYCHSVECYDNNQLVGGLYGVAINKMFAGESMFYLKPNCSKLCLYYLVEHLRTKGIEWIDCQQLTPLFKSFGAKEVSRAAFMKLLAEAVEFPIKLF